MKSKRHEPAFGTILCLHVISGLMAFTTAAVAQDRATLDQLQRPMADTDEVDNGTNPTELNTQAILQSQVNRFNSDTLEAPKARRCQHELCGCVPLVAGAWCSGYG